MTLGTDVGLGRFVLKFAAESEHDAIRLCVRTAVKVVLAVSVVIAAVLWRSRRSWPTSWVSATPGSTVIIILALAFPASALGSVALASTRAFGICSLRSPLIVWADPSPNRLGRYLRDLGTGIVV